MERAGKGQVTWFLFCFVLKLSFFHLFRDCFLNFICVPVFVSRCATCVGGLEGQKRALDLLVLDLVAL